MSYKLVNLASNVALRKGSNVTFDRIENSSLPTNVLTGTGYIIKGVEIFGDEIVTLTTEVKNASNIVVGLVGDQWLKVNKVGAHAIQGFTAVKHMGKFMGVLTVLDEGNPDPTPTPEVVYPDRLEIVPLDNNNQPIGPKKIYKVS